jgi:uncharacterized SAM-binding protein YcdF (DUF218 family)
MRSLVEGIVLAFPFYVLCVLGVLTYRAFRRWSSPGLRRWRYLLALIFLGTLVVSTPACGNAVARRIESRYPPRVATVADRHRDNLIVVLTGGWFRRDGDRIDIKISEDGWERLDAGIKLWQEIGGKLLIAGAPARDGSGRSVAGVMADAAQARGVPNDAILVESQSRDTYQNLAFSLPLLEKHRDHLWLVTSALHLPRAMGVAQKLGLQPIPYPCFYRASRGFSPVSWLPNNEGPEALERALHEELGMLLYRLRGWM